MRASALIHVLLAAATGCAAPAPGTDLRADEEAVRALARRAMEAENSEDLEAWLATVTDDVIVLTADGPIRGKQELRSLMAPSFTDFDWQGQWSLDSLEVSGDLAVMWGPIETVLIARSTGQRERSVGYHLDVARRQPDGTWRFTWWTTKTREVPDSAR